MVAVLLLLAIVLFIGFKYNKLKDNKEAQYEHDEAIASIGYLVIKWPFEFNDSYLVRILE